MPYTHKVREKLTSVKRLTGLFFRSFPVGRGKITVTSGCKSDEAFNYLNVIQCNLPVETDYLLLSYGHRMIIRRRHTGI